MEEGGCAVRHDFLREQQEKLSTEADSIMAELGVNMSCGASNISFGLPDRSAVNAGFLAMGMLCGLTCSITDPTNPVIRQAVLASDLLLGHDEYATRWIGDFRARKKAAAGNQ